MGAEGRDGVPVEERASTVKRAVFGAAFGNMVEWFDYASYGYLAATIAAVFFAPGNATATLLGTYAVFAISFVVSQEAVDEDAPGSGGRRRSDPRPGGEPGRMTAGY